MPERLPDSGEASWQNILGARDGAGGFLRQSHNDDGTLKSAAVTGGLGYTPVNKAGDTMTGGLVLKGPFHDIRAYGAVVDGVTNDAAAINSALTAASSAGGIVLFPIGTTATAGGHTVPRGVSVMGLGCQGSIVNHTGNNVCFLLDGQRTSPNYSDPAVRLGIRDLTIHGNTGAAACGIEIANTQSAWIERVIVGGGSGESFSYTNATGVALRLHNNVYWVENTYINDFSSRYNTCGIQLLRDGTGTESFGYQKWRNFAIDVPANGIGIDVGSTSASTVRVYNSQIEGNIWLEGNNAIGVNVTAQGRIERNCVVNIRGESLNAATGTLALKNRGVYRPNGLLAFDYGSPVATIDSTGAVDTKVNTFVFGDVLGADITPAPWFGCGTGNPNGVVSAPIGSLWVRRDAGGGAGIFFTKRSGTSTGGWAPIVASQVDTPTYGATITVNAHNVDTVLVTVTNTTGFTISNPPFVVDAGRRLVFDILNSSGGTMGAITWGSVYKLSGSFKNPPNGERRSISFYTPDGTNWVETGHTIGVSAAYTPTNVTTDRSYDANATTIDELADVIGTLIADLQANGVLG